LAFPQENEMNRYIPLNAQLQPVADHGGDHVATLDTQQNLIFANAGDADTEYSFADAEKQCADLRLGDKSDWRLPTVNELFATVDHTRHGPAVDPAAFPETENNWYWTSTPCAWRPASAAWCVGFGSGLVDYYGRGLECFVRAVRVASPASGQ
jgi:hypothetical protein